MKQKSLRRTRSAPTQNSADCTSDRDCIDQADICCEQARAAARLKRFGAALGLFGTAQALYGRAATRGGEACLEARERLQQLSSEVAVYGELAKSAVRPAASNRDARRTP